MSLSSGLPLSSFRRPGSRGSILGVLLLGLLLAAPGLLPGCADDSDPPTGPGVDPMPDFALPDVNPNSASYGSMVSPRDHVRRTSAWYFGAAT